MVKEMSANYPDCILTYCNFENYLDDYVDDDVCFYFGENSRSHSNNNLDVLKENFSSRIFYNQEQPCAYTLMEEGYVSSDIENFFTDIYTICPYSAKWSNELYSDGDDKFKPILFPIDEVNLISDIELSEKVWDSIFYGSVCGKDHREAIEIISKFKYNFFTLGQEYWYPNDNKSAQSLVPKITDVNVHTFDKWKIMASTKVIPIYNQLYIHDYHIRNIRSYDEWNKNEAWSHIDDKIAPQLKPRVTEAAFFKVLMLVKRDPWNVIEQWFDPDKDFIYFDTNEELEELIHETTTNLDRYWHIVENAYNKACGKYTTKHILEYMILNRKIDYEF
jgi:hypothetical protein